MNALCRWTCALALGAAGCSGDLPGFASGMGGEPVAGARTAGVPATAANPAAPRHRGVAWTAGRDPIASSDFEELASLGVTWIAQTPFGWQPEADGPELTSNRGRRVWWGERDEGIRVTTEAAAAVGIRTLLKPHIWLFDRDRDVWRGDIAMRSEADWATWFANYRDFMLHYARLAETLGIPALCIGTELHGTLVREDDWRALIDDVRQVYSGQVTYAANWYREYEDVPFWDALDWIGVQAYFPLTDDEFPSADVLEEGWGRWLDEIEVVQARFDRPVLFTEVGYRSVPYSGKEPWTWPKRGERTTDSRAFDAQAAAYEAMFRAAWTRPWLEGIYIWKWYPSGSTRDRSADFTPQGKPAERTMAHWFRGDGAP